MSGGLLTGMRDSLSKYFSFSPCFLLCFFREKYINIIRKMEEMLKSWFPNIKLQDQPAVTHTEESVPTKKPKVRLHKCCVRALRLHKAGCQEHMLTTR